MGRLADFSYWQTASRLRTLGFAFDRQAAGSHEIWFHMETNRYTTIPNHPCGHLAGHSQAGREIAG